MSFSRPYKRKWHGRGFSPGQQPEWQALKAAAWLVHCQREGLSKSFPDKKNAAFVDWYQRELMLATGHDSSADCNAGQDYDRAMAHFEALAGTGIKWQMRLYSGDVNRMMYGLRTELGAEALRVARVDEAYLLNAIRNGFGTREPWRLEREELIVILGEVKRMVRRQIRHAVHVDEDKRAAMGELWEAPVQTTGSDPDWTV